MSAYGTFIIKVTGCRPVDTFQVEEVMRTEHSTMDHLTSAQLRNLAKRAWAAVRQLRETDPDLFPTPQ